LAGFQENLGERAELLLRLIKLRLHVARVKLHNLVAGEVARIFTSTDTLSVSASVASFWLSRRFE